MAGISVESMLAELNTNLAAGKRTLEDMYTGGDRTYRMRDGTVMEIPQEQLQILWDACDDAQRISLKLPIYVSTDTSGETAAWKVSGRTEAPVVAKLLGRRLHRDDLLRLYYPDLKQLKSLIPDAFLTIFTP